MNDSVWYVLLLVVSVVTDFHLSFWFRGQIGAWEKKKKRNIEFIDFKVACPFWERMSVQIGYSEDQRYIYSLEYKRCSYGNQKLQQRAVVSLKRLQCSWTVQCLFHNTSLGPTIIGRLQLLLKLDQMLLVTRKLLTNIPSREVGDTFNLFMLWKPGDSDMLDQQCKQCFIPPPVEIKNLSNRQYLSYTPNTDLVCMQ